MIYLLFLLSRHLLIMVLPKRLLATFEEGTGFITCPMCQGKGICLRIEGDEESLVLFNRGLNLREKSISPPQRPTSNELNEPFRLPVLARSKRTNTYTSNTSSNNTSRQNVMSPQNLDTTLSSSISETNIVCLPTRRVSRQSIRQKKTKSKNEHLRFSLESLEPSINNVEKKKNRSKSVMPIRDIDTNSTISQSINSDIPNADFNLDMTLEKSNLLKSHLNRQKMKTRRKNNGSFIQSPPIKEVEQSCLEKPSSVATIVKKLPVNYELELLPMNEEPEYPQEIIRSALIKLRTDDWSTNVEGIEEVIQVSRYFPSMVDPFMTVINRALIVLLHSLRSMVVRLACQASFEIFRTNHNIQRPEFDELVSLLLNKTADMNKYIRQDANEALDSMIRNVAPCHSVRALISRGFSHKNPLVRTAIVRLLTCLVTINGPEVILYSISAGNSKETRKKILNMLANYLGDSNLITRTYSKKLYKSLKNHPDFEVHFYNEVERNTVLKISKTLESLRLQINGDNCD